MKRIVLLLAAVLSTTSCMVAQDATSASAFSGSSTFEQSVHFELGGPTNLLGLSYERRFLSDGLLGFRTGLAYGYASEHVSFLSNFDSHLHTVTVPLEANVLLFHNPRHKFEAGAGASLGVYREDIAVDAPAYASGALTARGHHTCFGSFLFLNAGYRFVSRRGFVLRAGLTAATSFIEGPDLFERRHLTPYISFGKAF